MFKKFYYFSSQRAALKLEYQSLRHLTRNFGVKMSVVGIFGRTKGKVRNN